MTKYILGIETSCDDTSSAIITSEKKILSNVVLSQISEHIIYKGVVPEIASRAHMNYLQFSIEESLKQAKKSWNDIDLIAATGGPGLIGGVIVGTMFAKTLSSVLNKPYIAVNHLEGHALTSRLTDNIEFPYLLLLISGGHCQFIAVLDLGNYLILGTTLDDAAGEAFDKVAKMLDLGYPGGPIIEERAINGNNDSFKFPISMSGREGCDMSFSGLKTSVRKVIEQEKESKYKLSEIFINDICASFQYTILQILKDRIKNAISLYENFSKTKNFVVAGGVSANKFLISNLSNYLQDLNYNLFSPPIKLCTDNAAMIAWAGYERWKMNFKSDLSFCPRARWPLNEINKI